MGYLAIAALIVQGVFAVVLVAGWSELGPRGAVVFVALWLVAFIGRNYVPYGPDLFTSYVAVLDIVLVLMVFKGDVTLK